MMALLGVIIRLMGHAVSNYPLQRDLGTRRGLVLAAQQGILVWRR